MTVSRADRPVVLLTDAVRGVTCPPAGGGLMVDGNWRGSAVCAQSAPNDLFVRGAAQRSARDVCFTCPVRMECVVEALEDGVEFGVWGGMTERERRALRRAYPDVTDWAAFLAERGEEIETPSMVAARQRALVANARLVGSA